MVRITTKCLYCGQEFETYSGRPAKFCSKNCHSSSMKKSVDRICRNCGKTFQGKPSDKKFNTGIFCSNQCKSNFRRKRIKRKCLNCNKEFEVWPSVVKRGWGNFCSKQCKDQYLVGDKASAWQGGLSFEPYCQLFNTQFKERVRDHWDRKCGICGKIEKKERKRLHVHHVNYDKQTCCNSTPPLFIPLCHSHHSMTNSNREYWEDILTNYIMIYYNGKCY